MRSLLILKMQGWDLVDLTYFKINDSHETLRRSWDGLPVTPSPRASQLSGAAGSCYDSLDFVSLY